MMETNDTASKIAQKALRALRFRVSASRAALALETFARSFWPALVAILFGLAVWLWGLHAFIPIEILPAVKGAYALGLLYLIWSGAKRFAWPTQAQATERLDLGLNGRPLSSLSDELALGAGNQEAEHIWALHLQKMAEKAKNAKVAKPDLALAGQDRWAIRLVALLAVGMAALFAREGVLAPIDPTVDGEITIAASGPSYEAWAEPPSYTAKPTLYLNDVPKGLALDLPKGTRVTVRIYGYEGKATLREDVSANEDAGIPADASDVVEVDFDVVKSGKITVSTKAGETRHWTVSSVNDGSPEIDFNGEVSRTLQGEMEVPYIASDDYGILGASLTVDLDISKVDRVYGLALDPEPRDPLLIDIPLPFTADTSIVEDILVDNHAKHPWATLPSQLTLNAVDADGNTGASDPLETIMPGKRFFDALSKGIVEVRRDLLWNRANAERTIFIIKAITYKPETLIADEKAYLMVRTALRRMEYNSDKPLTDELLTEVADLLWNAALIIEDGDLDDAKERLRRAQERLKEAMDNGATKEEIEELMQELREATKEYIAQLERRPSDGNQQAGGEQNISRDQIQQMMDEIQDLMDQGRMEEARILMDELQRMLENLQITEGGQGGDSDQEDMQNTLREQQELADETFEQLQEEFERQRREREEQNSQGQNGGDQQQGQQQDGQQPGGEQGQQGQQQGQQQGGQQQGNQGQGQEQGPSQGQQQGQGQGRGQAQNQTGRGGNSPADLAERQEALRQMLDGQSGNVPNDGSEAGRAAREALENAQREMGEARDSLEQGDIAGALDNQADAMDALREGMRNMNEQSRQAQGQQDGDQQGEGNGAGGNQQQSARDPLGRSDGSGFGNDRAQNGRLGADRREEQNEVLDEIQRRSLDRTRPKIEQDYLRRLLDRF